MAQGRDVKGKKQLQMGQKHHYRHKLAAKHLRKSAGLNSNVGRVRTKNHLIPP